MLFKLPDPPAGQTYVNKVTANGAQTVLVPTSSISEDVCTATGRTWEEEARLYNIRNAPDGQPIAKPGDPFYQTADSMKNRNKSVNGAVSAGSLKFFNMLSGASADNPPNLSDTMSKIKDGSINADITANLSKIGEVSGSLPGVSSAQLEAAKADIAAKMAKAQADLPKLLAMAQANVDILTKKKIAETGKPPTEAEIKAAQGALTIFQDGPKLLESKAAEISKAVAESGKDFGANLSKGLSSAKDFAKAGINKVTNLAKTAGAKITEFANGVPSQTIPDPANPGQTLPNPAYTTFAANPANAAKIAKVTEVTGKMNAAAADMTTKFAEIETAQASAVTGGMADLKAFAFAAQLSQPATGFKATIQNFTLNKDAFDPTNISKTFATASKLGPSIDTSLYKSTKDEDLTYTGDDGIVWDRVNAERLRRSLSGLPTPRPKEPPLVPAGPTPPKDPETVIKTAKIVDPDAVTATKATATKKKAVFDKELDEKIYNPFVKEYYKILTLWDTDRMQLEKQVLASSTTEWVGDAADFNKIKTEYKRIIEEKPDASTRTAEENLIVKQRNYYRGLSEQYSELFKRYSWSSGRFKEVATQYAIVREAFMASKTFGDLAPSTESAIMANVPNEWKKYVGEVYKSYAEFAKANPDKDKPPTA